MTPFPNHWIVILAGGSGTRLRGWAGPDGAAHVPKCYRNLDGDGPLIDGAWNRARRLAPAGRTVIVVAQDHEAWWLPLRARWPGAVWMVQRHDRGTGGAILSAALLVLGRDADAVMTILPADHAVRDDKAFAAALKGLRREAARQAEALILLGAPAGAGTDEDGYGWIVPEPANHPTASNEPALRKVARFVPRPAPGAGDRLRADGALVDTFLVTGTARTLLKLFKLTRPTLVDGALENLLSSGLTPAALIRSQATLPHLDFGADVLASAAVAPHLLVARLPVCGWADLGTPERVEAWRGQVPQ
ncbi:MAG TPA: sugar phosphate nucleotidyltransferase [Candidatus Eisenbacteria bacterium]